MLRAGERARAGEEKNNIFRCSMFSITWYSKKQCSLVFQDNDAATNLKSKLIQIIDTSKKSDENIHTVDNDGEVLNDLDNTPL